MKYNKKEIQMRVSPLSVFFVYFPALFISFVFYIFSAIRRIFLISS